MIISTQTGYTHDKVRYSLRALENENLIDSRGQGAIITEESNIFLDKVDAEVDKINQNIIDMKR